MSNNVHSIKRKRRVAIFLDTENVAGWIKHRGLNDFFRDHRDDNVLVRKAYADWSNGCSNNHQDHINSHGFEFVHCVHPVSGKNSADIQMSIDIIECALTMPEIDCFVIATKDSDFSPVFRRLRAFNKDVIAVCDLKSSLSRSVRSSCIELIDACAFMVEQPKVLPAEALKVVAPQYGISSKQVDKKEVTPKPELTVSPLKSFKTMTLVESESLDKRYVSALKKHNLSFPVVAKIKSIYKESTVLKHTGYESVDALKAGIFASVNEKDPMIAESDAEKLFNYLELMEYFESKVGKDKKTCFYIKKTPMVDFMVELDKAIITVLLQLKDEINFEVKAADFKKIAVSSMTIKDIEEYIDVETFRLAFQDSMAEQDKIAASA